MKILFTLIALGVVTLVSADQYYPSNGRGSYSCPSCNSGVGSYQDQSNNANYYQRGEANDYYQGQQLYSQRNDQYYQQQDKRPSAGGQQMGYDNDYDQRGGDQNANSDQEISKRIQVALSAGWFSKGFQGVSFNVTNGNVSLRGSVDTLENKSKVEDIIKKIDGVRQVNNQITIAKGTPNTYSDSQLQASEKNYPQDSAANYKDRQLNAKIRDELSSGWFSKGNETLVITTTNGVVVISGTVDKVEDMQKLNDQIKDMEGVRSVNSQLTVKSK